MILPQLMLFLEFMNFIFCICYVFIPFNGCAYFSHKRYIVPRILQKNNGESTGNKKKKNGTTKKTIYEWRKKEHGKKYARYTITY